MIPRKLNVQKFERYYATRTEISLGTWIVLLGGYQWIPVYVALFADFQIARNPGLTIAAAMAPVPLLALVAGASVSYHRTYDETSMPDTRDLIHHAETHKLDTTLIALVVVLGSTIGLYFVTFVLFLQQPPETYDIGCQPLSEQNSYVKSEYNESLNTTPDERDRGIYSFDEFSPTHQETINRATLEGRGESAGDPRVNETFRREYGSPFFVEKQETTFHCRIQQGDA